MREDGKPAVVDINTAAPDPARSAGQTAKKIELIVCRLPEKSRKPKQFFPPGNLREQVTVDHRIF
jgi:hypothetical protein